MKRPPSAYLHGFTFTGKVDEIAAARAEEVTAALALVEKRVASGLHAAGFVSYDAASALNGDLTTGSRPDFPLLWFGLFTGRSSEPIPACDEPFLIRDWESAWGEERFCAAVRSIRELIAAGDCYQVNLTMRQSFSFSGSPLSFFNELYRRQPTPYGSYLEMGRYRILSASPELFFSLADGVLTTRPMKGTAARGRWLEEDEAHKEGLKESAKERAENVMIVDLLRNDMAKVSRTGSVRVDSLFDVETHPTVHQMTSTIQSRLRDEVAFLDVMQALFPCGSVTGAPKRRSMEIIEQLEEGGRGLYTGGIGYLSPGGESRFSVAIRTAVIDVESGRGEIGVGSGITYDSSPAREYAESLSKASFAREPAPQFHLIESLLYEGGYFLLERHLQRLTRSAAYFAFTLPLDKVHQALETAASGLTGRHKVRLLLFQDGSVSCAAAPIEVATDVAAIGYAAAAVNSADPFLYHKTSRRGLFSGQAALHPELDQVIFLNERGEVTEGATSNIVAVLGGERVTPPLQSGLLPGVFREELLCNGVIVERVLTQSDLEQAQEIYLVNSVRKWRRARLRAK